MKVFIKITFLLAIPIGIGYKLGCIPIVNELTHWYLFSFIPLSGPMFGIFVGYLLVSLAYYIKQTLNWPLLFVLSLGVAAGYFAIDYGIYSSLTINEGSKLSSFLSFSEYMKINLRFSTLTGGEGEEIEWGSVQTKLTYLADLIGAFVAAGLQLSGCSGLSDRIYCEQCNKIKETKDHHEVFFTKYSNSFPEIKAKIDELFQDGGYKEILYYFQYLIKTNRYFNGDFKIVVSQGVCPDCLESTIVCNIYEKKENIWEEMNCGNYLFTSNPGEYKPIIEEP